MGEKQSKRAADKAASLGGVRVPVPSITCFGRLYSIFEAWFETELLAQEENLFGLAAINRELIAKVGAMDSPQRVVLDIDSTEIPVYGQQEASA